MRVAGANVIELTEGLKNEDDASALLLVFRGQAFVSKASTRAHTRPSLDQPLPRPAYLPQTRLPFERHVLRVTAAVTLVREEDDVDLHVVLQTRPSVHMIAEAPSAPMCTPKATAYRKRQMAAARRAVRVCRRARVTGVAFFDFLHGQTGVAPNGIELHSILGFACLEPNP